MDKGFEAIDKALSVNNLKKIMMILLRIMNIAEHSFTI